MSDGFAHPLLCHVAKELLNTQRAHKHIAPWAKSLHGNYILKEAVSKCIKIFFVFTDQNSVPKEVMDAPNLSVFKRHLDNALNNLLQLLVSPELVSQLD